MVKRAARELRGLYPPEGSSRPVPRLAAERMLEAAGVPALLAERNRFREALQAVHDVTVDEPDAVEAATTASHIAADALAQHTTTEGSNDGE
jgi:hypothetical protein